MFVYFTCIWNSHTPSPPHSTLIKSIPLVFELPNLLGVTQYFQLLTVFFLLILLVMFSWYRYYLYVRFIPLHFALNLLNKRSSELAQNILDLPHPYILLLILLFLECDLPMLIVFLLMYHLSAHIASKVTKFHKCLNRLSFGMTVLTIFSQAYTQPSQILSLFLILVSGYKITRHPPSWLSFLLIILANDI